MNRFRIRWPVPTAILGLALIAAGAGAAHAWFYRLVAGWTKPPMLQPGFLAAAYSLIFGAPLIGMVLLVVAIRKGRKGQSLLRPIKRSA